MSRRSVIVRNTMPPTPNPWYHCTGIFLTDDIACPVSRWYRGYKP